MNVAHSPKMCKVSIAGVTPRMTDEEIVAHREITKGE